MRLEYPIAFDIYRRSQFDVVWIMDIQQETSLRYEGYAITAIISSCGNGNGNTFKRTGWLGYGIGTIVGTNADGIFSTNRRRSSSLPTLRS